MHVCEYVAGHVDGMSNARIGCFQTRFDTSGGKKSLISRNQRVEDVQPPTFTSTHSISPKKVTRNNGRRSRVENRGTAQYVTAP